MGLACWSFPFCFLLCRESPDRFDEVTAVYPVAWYCCRDLCPEAYLCLCPEACPCFYRGPVRDLWSGRGSLDDAHRLDHYFVGYYPSIEILHDWVESHRDALETENAIFLAARQPW